MKILLLSILIAITLVVIPNVDAESYNEIMHYSDLPTNTHQERFEALSFWASDNKDILGKDISFYVENMPTMKGDFIVSNVSLIPDENTNHILSFDTTVKLKSELKYPHEFVMDGRSLTVWGVTVDKEYFNFFGASSCDSTGANFNSESGDTGTFHSCFAISANIHDLNSVDWEEQGVAIFVDKAHTGLQLISVISMADIQNIEEETISFQQTSWFDSILNFFKSLFS